MNTRQRVILLVGALVIVVMCLFPPWMLKNSSLGYRFVFAPPRYGLGFMGEYAHNRIDLYRLALQVLCTCLVAGALYLVAKPRKPAGRETSAP